MKQPAGFFDFTTLSFIEGIGCYMQLGLRLDVLDNLFNIFDPKNCTQNKCSSNFYSVYSANSSTSITCISSPEKPISRNIQQNIQSLINLDDPARVFEDYSQNRISAYKIIFTESCNAWNKNKEFFLVVEVERNLKEQFQYVNISHIINLSAAISIILLVFYGYNKIKNIFIEPHK